MYKLDVKKMTITLRLRPEDAVLLLGYAYREKMITQSMYDKKCQKAKAECELNKRTIKKDW